MSRYTPRLSVTPLEGRENPASPFLAFGAVAGGLPLVEVQQPDGTVVSRFQVFEDGYRGGVRAAAAELDGNSKTLEVVAAAGPGGGPVIKVFSIDLDTSVASEVSSFFAFEPTYRGGLRVAAGRVAGDTAVQQIVIGADAGGGPRVQLFDIAGTPVGGPLGNFFAFEPSFTGGLRVAAGELDGNARNGDELVVAAGPGGGPRMLIYRADGAIISDTFAFAPTTLGGVNVAVDATGGLVDRLRVDGEASDLSQRNVTLNADAVAAVTPIGEAADDAVSVLDAVSLAQLNGAFVMPNTSSGLSPGFVPTAGSVFGVTGSTPFDLTTGTTGFSTNGFDTTFGVAGLGTNGFGTGGFSTNGFGTSLTGFGTNSGFNTFGTTNGLDSTALLTGGTAFGGPTTIVPTSSTAGIVTGF